MSTQEIVTSVVLSDSALWALESLSRQRYGKIAPILNWSISQELVKANFIKLPIHSGKTGNISVTAQGIAFLRTRVPVRSASPGRSEDGAAH